MSHRSAETETLLELTVLLSSIHHSHSSPDTPIVIAHAVVRRVSFRPLRAGGAPEGATRRHPAAAPVAEQPEQLARPAFGAVTPKSAE